MHLLLAECLERTQPCYPTFLNDLTPAAECQRPCRHVLGDDRARADIGPLADRYRRDQRRIRADERVAADLGPMLGDAIIIAGDGAGPDIGAGADQSVADIAQMIGFGAGLDYRFLDLDEIADP